MEENCVFCNIVKKNAMADILMETDSVIVIKDIMPKAPTHLLIISKKHIPSVNELTEVDRPLIADMILAAKDLAIRTHIADTGYKLVWNVGKHGGQVIPHIHLHLLGGKQLAE